MTDERIYRCRSCDKMRTKAEGGSVFSLCDECWDKRYPKKDELEKCALTKSQRLAGVRESYIRALVQLDQEQEPRYDSSIIALMLEGIDRDEARAEAVRRQELGKGEG